MTELEQECIRLIRGMWPLRNDYYGVRLTVRSQIRALRKLRSLTP